MQHHQNDNEMNDGGEDKEYRVKLWNAIKEAAKQDLYSFSSNYNEHQNDTRSVFCISMKWIQDLISYLHADDDERPSELPLLDDKESLNQKKHGQDYHFVGSSLFLLYQKKFGSTSEKAFDKNRIDISIVQGEIEWPLDWPLPLGFEKNGGKRNKRMEWKHLLVDVDSLFRSWKISNDPPSHSQNDGDDDYIMEQHRDNRFNGKSKMTGFVTGHDDDFNGYDSDRAPTPETTPVIDDEHTEDLSSPVLYLPASTTRPTDLEPLTTSLTSARKRKRYGAGLSNLGNTCFMNSSIQCLAHTPPLRHYFLSGEFRNDLNRDNPLGTGGELAIEFARLLNEMWGCNDTIPERDTALVKSNNIFGDDDTEEEEDEPKMFTASRYGSYRKSTFTSSTLNNPYGSCYGANVVCPRNFKYILGKHAEQFVGYNQHDSQELATYLLDALHEDTNRVSKKPYIEKPEQKPDESDEEAGKRAWSLHLKREDSRVVESFVGQVKSRVECPKEGCGRVSTTYDPFMYLSVPLPGATERVVVVTFVDMILPSDNNQNHVLQKRKLKVKISKTAKVDGLKKVVASMMNEDYAAEQIDVAVHEENLTVVDVWQKSTYTWLDDNYDVSRISDSSVNEENGTFVFHVASVESIRAQVRKDNTQTASTEKEVIDTKMNPETRKNRLSLNEMITKDLIWEVKLAEFVENPVNISTLLKSRHTTHEKRMNEYEKAMKFINRCYESQEVVSILSSKEHDEEKQNGKDDTVVPRLSSVNILDFKDRLSIEEICEQSSSFKNIRTPEDLAVFEYCVNEFYRSTMKIYNERKEEYKDGGLVEILFHEPNMYSTRSLNVCAGPFIFRIAPTLTVFGLRKLLAEQFGAYLQSTNIQEQRSTSTFTEDHHEEDASKDSVYTMQDPIHDKDQLCDNSSSDAFDFFRTIPLTYAIKSKRQSSHSQDYRRLGSIENEKSSSVISHVNVASSTDICEQESVLDIVGNMGTINVNFSRKGTFDRERWNKVLSPKKIAEEKTEDTITLYDCIKKHCQLEQLEESEMWYCSSCKEHVQAWKQEHLYRTPPILIIHLKRFHYSAMTHRRDKIDVFVDFPLKGLDLRNDVMTWEQGEEPIYDCYAVSNHFGGLGGGHYTAYALNDENEWCNFDDSRVTTNVDENEVVSKAAYVLYYRRRDVKLDDTVWLERAHLSDDESLQRQSAQVVPVKMDVESDNAVSDEGMVTPNSTSPAPSSFSFGDDELDATMV